MISGQAFIDVSPAPISYIKDTATNIFFLRDSLTWLSFLYSKSRKGADDISN